MHIEPGIVTGAKLLVGYATAAGALAVGYRLVAEALENSKAMQIVSRSVISTALVFSFFQLLPHPPVGVSEVHLILGSTLFLLFGPAAAVIGLALGLTMQGMLFAPWDLPQLGMNLTTLLVPLFALIPLARRMIPEGTRYADLSYREVLTLSATYQFGIVGWVTFWTLLAQGVSVATFASIGTFAAAYLAVILIEPLIDLAALGAAKGLKGLNRAGLMQERVLATA